MNSFERSVQKIRKKLINLLFCPIPVFCFHHVSDSFDSDTMLDCDWIQTEDFKRIVLALKQKCTFISLEEAYGHIADDKMRLKRYAALTADDGWASVKTVLPWLQEQSIPLTLFLNPAYFDGTHFRERDSERYLLVDDLNEIANNYSNVTFGMHGWEHTLATGKSESEFRNDIKKSMLYLKKYPNYIPYFAYPWGRYNQVNDCVLREFEIVSVLMDGVINRNDASHVHRELLDVSIMC